MFEHYSIAAVRAIMMSRVEAGRVGCEVIDTEHLLLGIMRVDPESLQEIAPSLTADRVRECATAWRPPAEKLPMSVDLPVSEDAKAVFESAVRLAETRRCAFVRTEHLLFALLTATASHAAEILEEADASLERAEALVAGVDCDQQQEGAPLSFEELI